MAPVAIVAELGINHGGDLDTALRMVEAAAEAGCDGVKVQAYRCKDFLPVGHPDWAMFEAAQLTDEEIGRLSCEARSLGLLFGATPQHIRDVEWLRPLCDFLKNGSDMLLHHDLIDWMCATGLPVWVSTGMSYPEEVYLPSGATEMVCTSAYPCSDEEANLRRIRPGSGFSDHTVGRFAAMIATARGAAMIEKHFTLDQEAEGPDHWFSADPDEMEILVGQVRMVDTVLGDGLHQPAPSELENRGKWRVPVGGVRPAA